MARYDGYRIAATNLNSLSKLAQCRHFAYWLRQCLNDKAFGNYYRHRINIQISIVDANGLATLLQGARHRYFVEESHGHKHTRSCNISQFVGIEFHIYINVGSGIALLMLGEIETAKCHRREIDSIEHCVAPLQLCERNQRHQVLIPPGLVAQAH